MKNIELGKIIQDLAPDFANGNPRNSEGAFYSISKEEIIFVYSCYKGESSADHATADLMLLRSKDGGNTFQEEGKILTCEQDRGINIMSVSLLPMENGEIGLFYLVRTNRQLLQMFLRRSRDGGSSWSDRVLCTPVSGFFVVNNDRVTRLSSGRILIPAARHMAAEEQFDSRSETVFFYSDDDGRTWNMSEGKCSLPHSAYCQSGLQEPGILELVPGYLWAWARTELGRQYEMFSRDGGNTWTACQPSGFTSPCSPLSMKRDKMGKIYAVWNPIPQYNGRKEETDGIFTGGRSPFVIARSDDNGITFSEPVAFETDHTCGYCYCAMHFTEDSLLLAYCAGGIEEKGCLNLVRIRKVELTELEEVFGK